MSKRAEIDKVLILATGKAGADLDKVKQDLSDLGVVIKVERELPPQWVCSKCNQKFELSNEGLSRAGYEVVEPLIEEK